MSEFFRVALLNSGESNGKPKCSPIETVVQGISDIEDKIKEKKFRLRRNSFGAKNPQKSTEKRLEDEKILRSEIGDLEKKLQIHQDLLTTTRDIFKHNLHFQVPVYCPPRSDLIPYFTNSASKSWVRGTS